MMLFPLLWGIMTSFKSASELLGIFPNKPNWMGLPEKFVTSNYELVFQFFDNPEGYSKTFYIYWGTKLITHKWNANFLIILINTLFYTIVGSLIQAVLPAITGYMCVMYKNKVSSIKCLKNKGKNKSRLFKDMDLAHTDKKSVMKQQL